MRVISFETVKAYSKNASYTTINSFENTKVFGEKGGHAAFCSIYFDLPSGRHQSFRISRATFMLLKQEGFKVCINEQNL